MRSGAEVGGNNLCASTAITANTTIQTTPMWITPHRHTRIIAD
jgi:hypothetical protein